MDKYFIWFIFYSFIGWTYETTLYSIRKGSFVNSGMMYGCICPIYGIGALMSVGLFSDVKSTLAVIVFAGVTACILEYASSWLIEKLFEARWWDYSDWPFNINGRVSLLSGFVFGILALIVVRGFHPALAAVTQKFNPRAISYGAMVFAVMFIGDIIFSAFRCRKIADEGKGEVKIVLKLPFDFNPPIMSLKAHVSGAYAVVTERGHDIFEYITQRLRDAGIIK